jgi:hypothetical protein
MSEGSNRSNRSNEMEETCSTPKEKKSGSRSIVEFTYEVRAVEPGILATARIFSDVGEKGFLDSRIIGEEIVYLELVGSELKMEINNKNGEISYQFPDEASKRLVLGIRTPEAAKAFRKGCRYKVSIRPI